MTIVTIFNIVLAIAVIGGVLRLLSWAIAASRPESLTVASEKRQPARRPTTARSGAHRSTQGARRLDRPHAG
ncbi:MAG: hypothetical protein ACR2NR_16270 [Solirubrobacteraceae bacterium]